MHNKLIRLYRAPLLLVDFLFTQVPVLAQKTTKPNEDAPTAWTTSNWFWLGGAVLVTVLFVKMTKAKIEPSKHGGNTERKNVHFLPGRVRKLMGFRKSNQL